MEYQTVSGDYLEAEVEVFYEESEFTDRALDENARRYVISSFVEEGGRVVKIKRIK